MPERLRVRGSRRPHGVAVALLLLVLASPGCSAPDREAIDPSADAAVTDAPMFAAVGDSITDADSSDFAAGDIGAASWVRHVVAGGHVFAGGWAEWGATTERMAEAVGPLEADVLVLLAGTNDVALGVAFETSATNLDRIVDSVGIATVVVPSIPPMDAVPERAEAYNVALEQFATDRGWRFVDASADLRTVEGTFREGMSSDGLHPSVRGAAVLGEAIAEALGG